MLNNINSIVSIYVLSMLRSISIEHNIELQKLIATYTSTPIIYIKKSSIIKPIVADEYIIDNKKYYINDDKIVYCNPVGIAQTIS